MAAYASTFQSIQNSVIAKLRLDATNDLGKVKDWINQGLARVAVDTCYFSASSAGSALTAGDTSQALPSALFDCEYVTCVYGGQSSTLSQRTFEQILHLRENGTSVGPPTVYYLRKNTVEFWPSAAGGEVLTYYGAGLPDALSGNTDVAGLPEPYAAKLIEYAACVEAADFKRDPQLFAFYTASYQQWLGAFFAFLNRRRGKGSQAVPVLDADGRPFGMPWVPHDPSTS